MTQVKTRIADELTQAQDLPHAPSASVPRTNVWDAIQYLYDRIASIAASAVSFTPAGFITSTNVQDAIEELEAAVDPSQYVTTALLASNDNGEGASLVGIEDAGGLITATDVEGALAELAADVAALDAAVVLKGTWDASSGSFPGAGTAQAGWSYIVSVTGTVDAVAFTANDRIVAIVNNASTSAYAANWHKLDYTDQVLSVAGKTGAVTLAQADVAGLTTADSPQFAGVNLGHAAETTLTGSAGKLSVEGHVVLTADEEDQGPLTGGASITPKALTSVGTASLTVDPRDRALQTVTTTGTTTLATMAHEGITVLYLTMGSDAGTPVTTGWTVDGDAWATTLNAVFRLHMERVGSIHYMNVRRLV